jgi:DNA anti-recombination protein RmuC
MDQRNESGGSSVEKLLDEVEILLRQMGSSDVNIEELVSKYQAAVLKLTEAANKLLLVAEKLEDLGIKVD